MAFRTYSAPTPHHGTESQGLAAKEQIEVLRTIRTGLTRMRA
jgi:hypothetical protein